MIPPCFLVLKIQEKNKKPLRLWLPLFLLWPIFLILAVLIIPFLFFISIYKVFSSRKFHIFLFEPLFIIYQLICALRGVIISVNSANSVVYIKIS